jgi:hypothetical protein
MYAKFKSKDNVLFRFQCLSFRDVSTEIPVARGRAISTEIFWARVISKEFPGWGAFCQQEFFGRRALFLRELSDGHVLTPRFPNISTSIPSIGREIPVPGKSQYCIYTEFLWTQMWQISTIILAFTFGSYWCKFVNYFFTSFPWVFASSKLKLYRSPSSIFFLFHLAPVFLLSPSSLSVSFLFIYLLCLSSFSVFAFPWSFSCAFSFLFLCSLFLFSLYNYS